MTEKIWNVVSVYNRYRSRGGEDEVFEIEGKLLQQHGCKVTYVTDQAYLPSGLIQSVDLAVNVVWSRKWHARFRSLLKSVNPHVVHIHNTFPNISPSIYYACQELHIPVLQTLHNYRLLCPAATFFRNGRICEECVEHSLWRSIRYGCYKESRAITAVVASMLTTHRWLRTWSRSVDCYIALTEFARRKFIDAGLPAEKIVVKPNTLYPDPEMRVEKGEYALFVGRLAPEKGVRTLLAAWEKLESPIPLRIVGDGPLRVELERMAKERSLYGIQFMGRVARAEVLEMLKRALWVVFPSEWYEGFPMTILESFASGVPIVGSRLGGVAELVDDRRTGLLFHAGDSNDLAAKLEWAWAHPGEMEAMGNEARVEYEVKYSPKRNYEMLMNIYEKVISSCSTTETSR